MTDVELAEGVSTLPRDEWNALVGDESPFLEWDWLASLESAGTVSGDTGWLPRPLVVRDQGRLIAACPLYVKGHSQGEFVFDWGWADAAERAGIRYYPKLLVGVPFTPVTGASFRVHSLRSWPGATRKRAGIRYYPKLLVGVPFTPVTGARFLVAPGQDRSEWTLKLALALREFCVARELSSVHVNFCLEQELEPLARAGFLTRVGIQYHWHDHGYESFEDYLAHFRSKRRNQIRRERREMDEQGVKIEALSGDEIPDGLFRPMYDFYLSTIESRYWGRQYLNFELFEELRDRFRDRLVFVVASQDGEPIAGTFNVAKGDALYGLYWGATRPLRHLHFNVCYYAAIEFCIERGLSRFEPGAGGDYKQLRGFDAQPTFSGHFVAEPRFADAVEEFLERERHQATREIEWIRDHSQLKKSRPTAPDPGPETP